MTDHRTAALLLGVSLALHAPHSLAAEESAESNGDKGLPMMVLGLVAKPFIDGMIGKFYNWFGQKTGVPMTGPLPGDCGDACISGLQPGNGNAGFAASGSTPSSSATDRGYSSANAAGRQAAFGMAVGAWVKPPRMPAAEADLELPQLWKKSSNGQGVEYTQVKLSILLTDGGLVAVGVQDEGRPVQLRDTFIVGKGHDGNGPTVALFPIPGEKRVEVIRIKPTLPRETLQVYVLPCQVSNDTRGADVGEGSEEWQDLQTQLPSAPPQFRLSRASACPNTGDVSWPEIYATAKPLAASAHDKRLYGTVGVVEAGQWYRLDIPYATGL